MQKKLVELVTTQDAKNLIDSYCGDVPLPDAIERLTNSAELATAVEYDPDEDWKDAGERRSMISVCDGEYAGSEFPFAWCVPQAVLDNILYGE